ncbi:hypothetical protein CERZMDRAFT_91143 [Cercospora zeae-maydis SCOH1-5]|uniref:Uncharacterized protein n=1 Tax=Cercospora zeae-maydis SCOH1-5 TaxID=717836 RepID=A0A6A6FA69_9PEZI|nr:hypothetical protein CERZMDRAFT_91143 [Cercospora zeae-maydis SCOH1-5]
MGLKVVATQDQIRDQQERVAFVHHLECSFGRPFWLLCSRALRQARKSAGDRLHLAY